MAERTVSSHHVGEVEHKQELTRTQERYFKPPVDIYETSEGLVVVADLPGVSKENLDVQVKDDILTIQAHSKKQATGNSVFKEFELVNFFRQFQLSDKVDSNNISAELKHGVLTLKLPKAEEAKPKRIEVKYE